MTLRYETYPVYNISPITHLVLAHENYGLLTVPALTSHFPRPFSLKL